MYYEIKFFLLFRFILGNDGHSQKFKTLKGCFKTLQIKLSVSHTSLFIFLLLIQSKEYQKEISEVFQH